MSFLIICGDKDTTSRIDSWLKNGYPNCDTIVASNAARGLKVLRDTEADLIVVVDPTAQIQLCRDIRRLSGAPLLTLGNIRDSTDIARAIEAGCDCYVDEAVSRTIFVAHVEALLRRASAGVDPTTRLLNARSVEPVISKEIERSRRYRHPFSVVVMNVSGLDRLHDGSALSIVNRALADIAGILKKSARTSDTLLRSGPTQFMVIMPESGRDAASVLMSRLHKAVYVWCVECGLLDKGVQTEYGTASWLPEEQKDLTMLLNEARGSMSTPQEK